MTTTKTLINQARKTDRRFKKIVFKRFGHMPTIAEWLTLPEAERRDIHAEAKGDRQ